MSYFMDTSSLVKIYHTEAGSRKALEIYKSKERIMVSELARIEFISTIHRKYREKELGSDALDILIVKFQEDADIRYEVLQFSSKYGILEIPISNR